MHLHNSPEEALAENGISACFPDDQISHLLDGDADKEGRVASPLQVQALVFGLQSRGNTKKRFNSAPAISHRSLQASVGGLFQFISVPWV